MNITLTPAELATWKLQAAREFAALQLAEIPLEELQTVELAFAAQSIGFSPKQAATVLPVIEVGPRKRRVSVKALKDFLAARTVQPVTAG